MTLRFSGRVWKFGDNINGDDGILDFSAVRDHSKPFDETSYRDICFVNIDPRFRDEAAAGDIVVGGRNFAKPGHDQVVVAIKSCGIAAIICESCEARFVRKGINIGLPILVAPGVSQFVEQGGRLEVDLIGGKLRNLGNGAEFGLQPYPPRILEILKHGGVINYLAAQFARA
jgi:3-isopropylmalate/(R)-2-methylmalate dehydratase small subunit